MTRVEKYSYRYASEMKKKDVRFGKARLSEDLERIPGFVRGLVFRFLGDICRKRLCVRPYVRRAFRSQLSFLGLPPVGLRLHL